MNLKNRLSKLEQTKRQTATEADCICFPPDQLFRTACRGHKGEGRQGIIIAARDEEGGDGIPGHVVLVQVEVRLESKDHIKKTRQLACTSSIEPL